MTATTICFGISKGGCSKSSTTAITAHLLAKMDLKKDEKILCVDMDSQGNLTSLLTGEYDVCNAFHEKTILEGIKERNVRPFIIPVTDQIDVVPSNDVLSVFTRYLYTEYSGNNLLSLKKSLEPVLEDYKYILIDTPPALSEQTQVSIAASDFCVIMFDGSLFAYHGIQKFIEIVVGVKERIKSNLDIAGILFAIVDEKATDTKDMVKIVDKEYEGFRFNKIIKRRAATKRLPIEGFNEENKELNKAVEEYIPFVKELLERVEVK